MSKRRKIGPKLAKEKAGRVAREWLEHPACTASQARTIYQQLGEELPADFEERYGPAPEAPAPEPESDEPTKAEMDDMAKWLAVQTWSDFAQSVLDGYVKYRRFTPRQWAAVCRMREKVEARSGSGSPTSQNGKPRYEPQEGELHVVDGVLHRVRKSRTSGNLYAVAWVDGDRDSGVEGDWSYVGRRPFRRFSDDTRASLEQAKAFGRETGVCCVCGRTLTDPDSIAAGIGPVCATRF